MTTPRRPVLRVALLVLGAVPAVILYLIAGRRRAGPVAPAAAGDRALDEKHHGPRPRVLEPLDRPTDERGDGSSVLRLLAGVAVVCCGVLLIALAYAAARDGRPHGELLLWAGRGLTWLPLMLLAVGPRVPDGHRVVALAAQAAMQSLVKWLYAPRAFRFPDELQHVRTSIEVQAHHTLDVQNPVLPISPSYPGLESVTNAVASVGHLSIFAAGTLVVSAAHVALVVCAFAMFRTIGLQGRNAAAATLILAIAPLHPFFDTSFVYSVPALLLMVATIALVLDLGPAPGVTGGLCVVILLAIVVTHHVTTWATLLVLALAAVVARLGGDRIAFRRLVTMGMTGLLFTAVWTASEASDAVGYVSRPVTEALSGLTGGNAGQALPPSPSPGPVATIISPLAFLVGAVLIAGSVRALWRRGGTGRWLVVVSSIGFYVALAVRVVTGNAELAGRGFTYAFVFACVPMAATVIRIWAPMAPAWRPWLAGTLLTVVFTGFTVSFPPRWEALPGSFQVAGDMRGVDERNTVAARWAAGGLGLGWRVGCDKGTCSLFGSYGRQEAINNASPAFYATSFDTATDRYVRDASLDFVAVDRRLGLERPVTGEYFRQDIGVGTGRQPIPRDALDKFDRAAHVSRVYDNGTVRIYDVREQGRRAR